MEFDSNRPIYIQIMDSICEKIISGELSTGERILSVREYGSAIGVNPNTVARSYEKLTDMGIIYNKRGIGYFVSDDAKYVVLEKARRSFIDEEVPKIFHRMELLNLDISVFDKYLLKHKK